MISSESPFTYIVQLTCRQGRNEKKCPNPRMHIIFCLDPTGLFSASSMHSRWKLTSIRRCSGGITEPSANNLNSWYSWGSISPMPKIFNACFEIFHEPLAMFCREKCSVNIRQWSATNCGIFAEQSPNIRRYFLI